MKKNYAWFQSLKWDESCLTCQAKHNGACHSKQCAEDNYDEWGDPIPLYVYHADGNTLQKYLENKRKRMEDKANEAQKQTLECLHYDRQPQSVYQASHDYNGSNQVVTKEMHNP